MFLNTNFVALTAFQRKFGVLVQGSTEKSIPTRWQSALFQSGQCGAFVGVFLAGPITNRLGYRLTTILALVLMNATIFISFFVSYLPSVSPEATCRLIAIFPPRRILSPSSSSDRRLKACLGASSLQTLRPTPARLSLSSSEAPARPRCR